MAITGTNNVPLGKRRLPRQGSSSRDEPSPRDDRRGFSNQPPSHYQPPSNHYQSSTSHYQSSDSHYPSSASHYQSSTSNFQPPPPPPPEEESRSSKPVAVEEEREGRSKKRRSRWGDASTKVNIPGMPTTLPSNMSPAQVKNYLIYLRLEEINGKLREGFVMPPENERSPSPEPQYDTFGKRVNTRDVRFRRKLEEERFKLIEQALKENPDFRPPADFKRPNKVSEKFFIPSKDHPDINFIGLLIGPRGNTLKKMESETGCKISIRGKGSVKEGKRNDLTPAPGIDEELHCLVTGDNEAKVIMALNMIKEIIKSSAAVPEGQNELKRQQLRELASLNGTLRDDEGQNCTNCGAHGHRGFECQDSENFTVNLVCKICSGVGHVASDCTMRNNPEALEKARVRDQQLDSEYMNLMKDLNEDTSAVAKTSKPTNAEPTYSNAQATKYPNMPSELEGPSGYYGSGQGYPAPPDSAQAPWAQPGYGMPGFPAMPGFPPSMGYPYPPPPTAPQTYPGYYGYDPPSAPPGYPPHDPYQQWNQSSAKDHASGGNGDVPPPPPPPADPIPPPPPSH